MIKGFKDFLMRGNVVDLAVAVVIGTAFAKVVDAFVTVIMDVIGKLGGTPNFSQLQARGVAVRRVPHRARSASSSWLPRSTSSSSCR